MSKKPKKQEEILDKDEEVTEEETPQEAIVEDIDPIVALNDEIVALKDHLLRNQAELQNFKRRTNEERIKDRIYANLELVKKLITPLDNFELGILSETKDGNVPLEIKGFDMIRRDLIDALKEEGLKEIDALDQPFDPKFHMAVAKETVEGKDANIVIEVYQKGYTYKDRLIRPAMVKVSE